MTFDPDAPWWANTLLVAFIAFVPIVMSVRASRSAKRAEAGTEQIAATTEGQLNRVLHNVENSHSVGLRDDLDAKVGSLALALAAVGVQVGSLHDDVGGMHEELRGARSDVAVVHQELRDVRADERLISRRLTALEQGETVAAVVHGIADSPQQEQLLIPTEIR